jgi:hypothetical protein
MEPSLVEKIIMRYQTELDFCEMIAKEYERKGMESSAELHNARAWVWKDAIAILRNQI